MDEHLSQTAPVSSEKQTPLMVIGILFMITIGVSLLPASWLGITQEVRSLPPLDLSAIGATPDNDANQDGILSWGEFISESLAISPTAAQSVEVDPQDVAALNDPNNLTSSFSKNLYIASVALKQNGIGDALSEQETINQLIKEEAKKIAPASYAVGDIGVAKTETAQSKKAYGNALAKALKGLLTKESLTAELTSFVKFMESENEGDLIPLIKRVSELDAMIEALLGMDVPKSAVSVHVLALNRIATYRNTLDDLSKAPNDPLRATFSIENYQEHAIMAGRMYPEFARYFKEQGVMFASSESGYVFVGYTQ